MTEVNWYGSRKKMASLARSLRGTSRVLLQVNMVNCTSSLRLSLVYIKFLFSFTGGKFAMWTDRITRYGVYK